eukprot:Hpha_TRINITY_DN16649_c0_g11::TRINITY_DN16649_c0_g11_i1::g.182788::m.182788
MAGLTPAQAKALCSGDPLATTQQTPGCIAKSALARCGDLGTYQSTVPPWLKPKDPPPGHAGGLAHMQYFCEALHAPGAPQQNIERVPLREFFAPNAKQLVIPPFQRRYCWTAHLAGQWWTDGADAGEGYLSPGGFDPVSAHSCGRIILAPAPGTGGAWMVIDGQQRLVTTALVAAAIATEARSGAERARAEGQEHWESLEKVAAAAEGIIFRGKPPPMGPEPPTHEECGGMRLVPALADRLDFLSLVSGRSTSSPGAAMAKAYEELLQRAAATAQGPPQVAAESLMKALDGQLDAITAMRVELGTSEGCQQVFLWLEEKDKMGSASFLHRAREGKPLAAADLSKNLFLAPLLRSTPPEQAEAVVRSRWLPIERMGQHWVEALLRRFAGVEHKSLRTDLPAAIAEYHLLADAVNRIYSTAGSADDAALTALETFMRDGENSGEVRREPAYAPMAHPPRRISAPVRGWKEEEEEAWEAP